MITNKRIAANRIAVCILCLIAGTIIIGCHKLNKQNRNAESKEINLAQTQENILDNILCFRNEYQHKDTPGMKDIEELWLHVKNGKVTGSYNLFPAEKDKREGSLTGTMKDKVIEVVYTFIQEGITDTANLKIIIDDKKALISGGKPELGLNITIKKIDCE
jgi:hypothetical protein